MMSGLCIIEGCPGSTRHKKRGEKIYFFRALEDQLEEWSRVIPGNRKIQLQDKVCSRHFRDDDLIKEWNFVIEDKAVTMPRGRWTLRVGAVPEKFGDYKDDIRVSSQRKSKPKSLFELGGSSSEYEDHEEPRRNRVRKLKKMRSSKVVRKRLKRVSKTPKKDFKSCERSSGNTPKENCGKYSPNQMDEISWEKACDNFVDQLSSICAPAPSDKSDAEPAKRRGVGRPRKDERRPRVGRPRNDERRPRVGRPRIDERRPRVGRPRKDELGPRVGRPRKDEQRPRVGRPRKDERRSSLGRPCKDKWRSRLVSETSSTYKHSTRLTRKKPSSSEAISDMETENSVIVEEFVASGCDDTVDVEILNDPDSSSQITITECLMPTNLAVKTEKDDEGYENGNSVTINHSDSCSIISLSEDSTSRQGQRLEENAFNLEGVVVKREVCNCEGDSRCCEAHQNCEPTVLELPSTPLPSEEINQPLDEQVEDNDRGMSICPESKIDRNGRTEIEIPEVSIISAFSVSRIAHEVPTSQPATCEVDRKLIPTPQLDCREHKSQVSVLGNARGRRMALEPQIEALDLTTQCTLTRTPAPNLTLCCEEVAVQRNAPESDIEEKLPEASKNQQQVEESSDHEIDFQGFSSEEEDNLLLRKKHFQNTAKMATESTKLYFSKLAKACKSKATASLSENDVLPPRTRRRVEFVRRSSAEIAIDQLNKLDSMMPVRSKKPIDHNTKKVVKDSVWKIQEPSVEDGKVISKSHSLTPRLAPDSKRDEVLKCGRISSEVTVTKASNLSQRLDKVPSVSNFGQGLDKVTLSSNPVTANKLILKANPFTQSSKDGLISNKLSTNNDWSKDKLTMCSNQDLLKDKVTISSTHHLFKKKGTSAAENGPLKEKIPTTNSGPALSHLLYGSSLDRIIESSKSTSLDRIIESSKGTSLLDSVTSTSTCDTNVDKTSQILKKFKTDGVLALECVVLKEQVRQLQKELFLHKQMLIDSEHNAALLQRKLELQAQLPCANCVNFKRGFIGKETLI